MEESIIEKKLENLVDNCLKKFWYDRRQTVFLHSQKGKADSVAQLVEHPDFIGMALEKAKSS
jgi:hypothetical protein